MTTAPDRRHPLRPARMSGGRRLRRAERLATPRARGRPAPGFRATRPMITSSGAPAADLHECASDQGHNVRACPGSGLDSPSHRYAQLSRGGPIGWLTRHFHRSAPHRAMADYRAFRIGLHRVGDDRPGAIDRGESERAEAPPATRRSAARSDRSTDRGAERRAAVPQAPALWAAGAGPAGPPAGRPDEPDPTCPRSAGSPGPRRENQFAACPAQCFWKITIEIIEENRPPARRTNLHGPIRDIRASRATAVSIAATELQFGCHDMSGPEVAGSAAAAAVGDVVGHPG
jgi:hypothetical protein